MSTIHIEQSRFTGVFVNGRRYDDAVALPFRVWFGVLAAMIVLKLTKRRTRRHLAELDQRLLRDIGVTQLDAEAEIRKSYPRWFHPVA